MRLRYQHKYKMLAGPNDGGRHRHGRGHHRPLGGGRSESEASPRRRRQFDSAELRLMTLSLLEEQPRHGYDLIRALDDRSGGAYVPSPGMVYPLLTMLTDMGLVTEIADSGARKLLSLSQAGKDEVATEREASKTLFARLTALAKVRERTDAQPVRRAMHNLRAVLMTRLAQDSVNNDTIFAAVALIDSAAQQIERL